MKTLYRIFLFLLFLPIAAAAHAQSSTFPDQPITILVTTAPGGPQHLAAQFLAERLNKVLGQQVIVDFRTGASGQVGASAVLREPKDGYTLLVISSAYFALPGLVKSLPYDTAKDFVMVSNLVKSDIGLIVNPKLGVKSVADLIALAKSKPGKLRYGSSGIGSSLHLAGELLETMSGTDMVHVPYKGAAEAALDVEAGRIDFVFSAVSGILPSIKSGALVLLATTDLARSGFFPDVPTMEETGLKGYQVQSYYGLVAAAGTPPDIVHKLNTAIGQVLNSTEAKESLAKLSFEPIWVDNTQQANFLDEQVTKWVGMLKAAGIEPK